jgi:hypothetical protein
LTGRTAHAGGRDTLVSCFTAALVGAFDQARRTTEPTLDVEARLFIVAACPISAVDGTTWTPRLTAFIEAFKYAQCAPRSCEKAPNYGGAGARRTSTTRYAGGGARPFTPKACV